MNSCFQITDTGFQNLIQGFDQIKSLQTLGLTFYGYDKAEILFLNS